MDTKARNEYGINNRELTQVIVRRCLAGNRKSLNLMQKLTIRLLIFEKEREGKPHKHKHDLYSSHEKVEDNWDEYNHV